MKIISPYLFVCLHRIKDKKKSSQIIMITRSSLIMSLSRSSLRSLTLILCLNHPSEFVFFLKRYIDLQKSKIYDFKIIYEGPNYFLLQHDVTLGRLTKNKFPFYFLYKKVKCEIININLNYLLYGKISDKIRTTHTLT